MPSITPAAGFCAGPPAALLVARHAARGPVTAASLLTPLRPSITAVLIAPWGCAPGAALSTRTWSLRPTVVVTTFVGTTFPAAITVLTVILPAVDLTPLSLAAVSTMALRPPTASRRPAATPSPAGAVVLALGTPVGVLVLSHRWFVPLRMLHNWPARGADARPAHCGDPDPTA